MISKYSILVLILLVAASCNLQNNHRSNPGKIILASDPQLRLVNGIYLVNEKLPFTGKIKEHWKNGELRSVRSVTNGKEQGLSETFYENGSMEFSRWYYNGEKDSIHTGWWENGNKKYEYHFNNGSYNGLFTEWYQSGNMFQQVMYCEGHELYGRGWRETGKLYMNFVIRNGRRYGLNNSNLCYNLRNELVK